MKMALVKTFAVILLSFLSVGCATIYNPATERKEVIFINSAQEVQIGRSMSQNIITKETPLLRDSAKQLLVNRVGQRLVQVSDRRDIVYHFQVLDSKDLNAFALPGGYIYVYSGLLDKIDEDELAGVLAHEIGHVAAKHSVKKMQAVLGYQMLMGVALLGFGSDSPELARQVAGASDTVFDLLSKGYSREDEFLADQLAVEYTHAAGYDPDGVARVLELLNKEKGPSGRVFEVLSTHPRMEERIRKVKEQIAVLEGPATETPAVEPVSG